MLDDTFGNHAGEDIFPDADPTLHATEQRLIDLGVAWRARPLTTAPLADHVRDLAATGRSPSSAYALQEEFVLMQATATPPVATAPKAVRRRWLMIPTAAALLVAVLNVAVFAAFAHRPATSARPYTSTTITPTIATVAAQALDRYATGANEASSLTTGPDGALWFTGTDAPTAAIASSMIGRMTTAGALTTYPIPNSSYVFDPKTHDLLRNSFADSIIRGPDGNLWFTYSVGTAQRQDNNPPTNMNFTGAIGRITPAGKMTFFALTPDLPTQATNAGLGDLTVGPDNNLWFTASYEQGKTTNGLIGRITTTGAITLFPLPGHAIPVGIVTGPDKHVWFADGNTIGRMAQDGSATYIPITGSTNFVAFDGTGKLWFFDGNRMGRLDPIARTITYTALPQLYTAFGLQAGPNGDVWATLQDPGLPATYPADRHLYTFTTSGAIRQVTLPGTNFSGNLGIGPDGKLWLADFQFTGPGRTTNDLRSYLARLTP